jgi:4-cresol dehydrogenase (hydroxylating)
MLNLQTATPALDAALAAWSECLGPEHVITGSADLKEAATATFGTSQSIPAILRPGDRQQVQECLEIAGRFSVALHPISSGKNWGYGSRVPVADGCALLDLGRLNRIVDFSEELAYVTVEPGVTQAQVFEFLRTRKSRLWIDATGASTESSLIGNTLERGFGHTPYGDHFAHVCGMEVLLPNGQCIQTGFARFPGALAAPVSRWGLGPSLDGLFTQSNFGVVTQMTFWLMPAPEYFQSFYFRCDEEAQLGPVVEALRDLRLRGIIHSTVHVGNDYKVISGMRQYPFAETGGQVPLRGDLLAQLRKEFQVGRWNGSGALYGTRAQVAVARRVLRRELSGKVRKLQFLDDRMLRFAERFAKPYSWVTGWDLSRALELIRPVYGLMQGIPTNHAMASTYWRKRTAPPDSIDPDKEGCGLLWCSPVAPATGKHALELTQLSERLVLEHGFEPMISLSMVSERALTCVISLNYDRDVAGEDERAERCHEELLRTLAEHGYRPYRLNIGSMDCIPQNDDTAAFVAGIKNLADPHGILAPGKYVPDSRPQF